MNLTPHRTATSTRVLAGAAPALVAGWALHALVMHRRGEQARHDPLTGLLTRSGWTRRAQQIIRDRNAVVLLLDLDKFKEINDTHGHFVGDAVLSAVAGRLAGWCGPGGVAGRLGGDEFVAVIRDPDQVISTRVQDLGAAIAGPVASSATGEPVRVSASIGFARVSDDPAADLARLLLGADAAMYAAKLQLTGSARAEVSAYLSQPPAARNGRRWGRRGTSRTRPLEVAA